MPVGTFAEMESAIAAFTQRPGGSLMIGPDAFLITHIAEIAHLVTNNRLPTISVYRPFTVAGGLMSYGPDTADIFRQAASYVDRILKGESPADLPVQQPTKFEFIVNLKAAKGLGLTISSGVLAIADEVIE
jgi:putative tryptophan/tyrosine transport system substrate-binding protein